MNNTIHHILSNFPNVQYYKLLHSITKQTKRNKKKLLISTKQTESDKKLIRNLSPNNRNLPVHPDLKYLPAAVAITMPRRQVGTVICQTLLHLNPDLGLNSGPIFPHSIPTTCRASLVVCLNNRKSL